jgi:integrase
MLSRVVARWVLPPLQPTWRGAAPVSRRRRVPSRSRRARGRRPPRRSCGACRASAAWPSRTAESRRPRPTGRPRRACRSRADSATAGVYDLDDGAVLTSEAAVMFPLCCTSVTSTSASRATPSAGCGGGRVRSSRSGHRPGSASGRAGRSLPRTPSLEQMAAVIDCHERLRDRFLFALLASTGMRIGRALGLRHEVVAWERRIEIRAREGTPRLARSKGGRAT